jgi:hypothetical protein
MEEMVMSLSVGQIVNNRYRIARLLGQGGMGAVYRAWDLNLNIPVALKELIPEPGIDRHALAQMRAQFQREAQVLASLVHPNLPRVTDFFEWGGNAYLVMDYVEGENLEQLLARQGSLPEARVIDWAVQLLDALATCHERRVVHRDIKPQNIIIRPDGRAVLVDFGLVKLWNPRHPQTQRIVRGMGTPEYASPEHFRLGGQHTEPRSDVYSLGATLYHTLTGHEPPSAPDRWSDASSLAPPRNLGVNVRPQVESVLLQALALDPGQRFSSAREMGTALQAAAGIGSDRRPSVAGPVQKVVSAAQKASMSLPISRDTRWSLEMVTGMVMSLVGVLTIQVALFARLMTLDLYLGRTIWALLIGALGWFLGDLIFQALARPERSAGTAGTSRPTQRLVALTRRMARRLTTAQQVILLMLLLACAITLVWLIGPLIARIPFVARYVPFYALIGPLAYAATGRRPGRTLVAHTLVTTLAGAVLGARIGVSQDVVALLLASAGGGLLMEGAAFLAERLLLHR